MGLCTDRIWMAWRVENKPARRRPGVAGIDKALLEGEGVAVLTVGDFGFNLGLPLFNEIRKLSYQTKIFDLGLKKRKNVK